MRRVEDLVGPHDGDEVLGVGEVDDVVGVAGQHLDCLDLVAGNLEAYDGVFPSGCRVDTELSFLNETAPLHNYEDLPLGVVPVLALGNAGLGDVDADLAAAQ